MLLIAYQVIKCMLTLRFVMGTVVSMVDRTVAKFLLDGLSHVNLVSGRLFPNVSVLSNTISLG